MLPFPSVKGEGEATSLGLMLVRVPFLWVAFQWMSCLCERKQDLATGLRSWKYETLRTNWSLSYCEAAVLMACGSVGQAIVERNHCGLEEVVEHHVRARLEDS